MQPFVMMLLKNVSCHQENYSDRVPNALSAVAMLNLLLLLPPPLSAFLTKVTRTTSQVKLSVFQTKCQARYKSTLKLA